MRPRTGRRVVGLLIAGTVAAAGLSGCADRHEPAFATATASASATATASGGSAADAAAVDAAADAADALVARAEEAMAGDE